MRRTGVLSLLVIALAACVPQLASASETNVVSVTPAMLDAPRALVPAVNVDSVIPSVQVADLSIRFTAVAQAPARDSVAVVRVISVIASRTPAPSSVLASPDSALERSARLHRLTNRQLRQRTTRSRSSRARFNIAAAVQDRLRLRSSVRT